MVMENALKVVHVSKKFPGLPPRTPRKGAALPDTPWLLWRLRRSHAARARAYGARCFAPRSLEFLAAGR